MRKYDFEKQKILRGQLVNFASLIELALYFGEEDMDIRCSLHHLGEITGDISTDVGDDF